MLLLESGVAHSPSTMSMEPRFRASANKLGVPEAHSAVKTRSNRKPVHIRFLPWRRLKVKQCMSSHGLARKSCRVEGGGGACASLLARCASCLFENSMQNGVSFVQSTGRSPPEAEMIVLHAVRCVVLCELRDGSRLNVGGGCGSVGSVPLAQTSCALNHVLAGGLIDTWLILPVVICLSQRLSHANGSLNQ